MIEGIEEYLAKLTSMAEIEDEMFQSVDQCGEFVRDDARLRVPVDTGDLRKSIDHTTRKENTYQFGSCSICRIWNRTSRSSKS